MKASRLIYFAIVMIGFLTSCQQQNIDTNNYNKGELVSVKLTANYIQTKVSYTETADMKFQPEWQLEDKVIGFDDSDNTYTFSVSEVGKYGTAILEGMAPANCTLHLIYLCGAQATSINGKSLLVSYENQSGDETMPAVMISDGEVEHGVGTFHFTNAGAVIGINAVNGVPEGSTISKITVFGENLSAATIALEDNALKLTAEEKADDSISTIDGFSKTVLDANGRLSSEPHKPILIAVPANAVIKGINYSIEGSDDYVFTLSTPETLTANQYSYINSIDTIKYVSLIAKSVAVNKSLEMQALSDASGSLSAPKVTEVTECISDTVTSSLTKGTLVNNTGEDKTLETFASIVGSFVTKAYNGSSTEIASQTVTWDESSNTWVGSPVAYWPQGESLNFLAYANLPSGQEASIASTGVSTSHTVPASVDAQTDILFGHYSGSGNITGTAEIRFEHPLTAVRFLRGQMDKKLVIKSISIDGVASSGTATMDSDGEISWSDVGTYDYSVSQEGDASTGLELSDLDGYTAKLIGEPFIIIPQKLADHNVDVTVTFTDGTKAAATLTSDEWKPGHINTYTLIYHTYEYTFEFTNVSDNSQTFECSTEDITRNIGIKSKSKSEVGTVQDAEWVIKSIQVGTGDPVSVNATSFTDINGLTANITSLNKLQLTAVARPGLSYGDNNYWTNKDGISGDTEGSGLSPKSWEGKGVIDLSKMDFSKNDPDESINAHAMTTANCYIIRHAGTYKLPLVYGNGIVNGAFNEQSYYPDETGGNYRLERFQNHLGNGIISPFIEYNTDDGNEKSDGNEYLAVAEGANGYSIEWEDRAALLTDISIAKEEVTVKNAGGISETFTVSYLKFSIPQDLICQNNALISVKDPDGKVMWSWHIWTTNDPALLSSPIEVTQEESNVYNFFPMNNLGWLEGIHYPEREQSTIVLSQVNSGAELEIVVNQLEVVVGRGITCTYQWGRKDPMCTTDNPIVGSFNKVAGPVNMATSICNPDTFYTSNGNWNNPSYYNLWTGKASTTAGKYHQNSSVIKTVYDPSPAGYHVPASGAFYFGDKFYGRVGINGNIGYLFYTNSSKTDVIFLPASRDRSYTSGGQDINANDGNYWTAFHSDYTKVTILGCYPGAVLIYNASPSGYGFFVRPVSE